MPAEPATPATSPTSARGSGRARRAEQERGSSRTARGAETRRLLLEVAARLFFEQGYHATSVPDIVKAAGVGHGTFYEYFGSRHQILLALTKEAAEASGRGPRLHATSLPERIRSEIFWYLADRVANLQLWKVWHEASFFDPELAAIRRVERARRVERVRRGIEAGGAPPGIDPAVAASALNAMLEEFAYRWFVEGDGPGTSAADVVRASETVTAIWLGAIGLGDARA
jgi:AcrR family transcriptional regulator